jgi:hypothetical protein
MTPRFVRESTGGIKWEGCIKRWIRVGPRIKEARVEPLSTGGDRDYIQHVIDK